MNSTAAHAEDPPRAGRPGGSIVRTSRNSAQAALAATAPRTSSSHCMPVPSGALNGTAKASPSRPSGTVQRTERGMVAQRGHDGIAGDVPGGLSWPDGARAVAGLPGAVGELLGLERPGEDVALQVAVAHVAQQVRGRRGW